MPQPPKWEYAGVRRVSRFSPDVTGRLLAGCCQWHRAGRSICTQGHRYLTEWMTDIVLGRDHARQLASDDDATLGPAQRQ